jgi:hypothetical protein
VYLRARYYDPATGQFISRDPLTAMTGAPYSYGDENPLDITDPTGLFGWSNITSAAKTVRHFVVEHRGAIADLAAGAFCIGTAGTGCVAAAAGAALIGSEQTAQDDIARGATFGTILKDTGISLFRSAALALPGLAEWEEAATASDAEEFFARYGIPNAGWEAPGWFEYGTRFVNSAIFTSPSSLELYRALFEHERC